MVGCGFFASVKLNNKLAFQLLWGSCAFGRGNTTMAGKLRRSRDGLEGGRVRAVSFSTPASQLIMFVICIRRSSNHNRHNQGLLLVIKAK